MSSQEFLPFGEWRQRIAKQGHSAMMWRGEQDLADVRLCPKARPEERLPRK